MNQLNNIMMSEFGNFKLGDLGIARTMEKTTGACHLFRKEMLEEITACKLSKEKEIEQTEVCEDECWDDYDGETIGS